MNAAIKQASNNKYNNSKFKQSNQSLIRQINLNWIQCLESELVD